MKWQNRYPNESDKSGVYINDGTQPYITKDTNVLSEAISSFKRTYDNDDPDESIQCTATNLKTGKTKKFWL